MTIKTIFQVWVEEFKRRRSDVKDELHSRRLISVHNLEHINFGHDVILQISDLVQASISVTLHISHEYVFHIDFEFEILEN